MLQTRPTPPETKRWTHDVHKEIVEERSSEQVMFTVQQADLSESITVNRAVKVLSDSRKSEDSIQQSVTHRQFAKPSIKEVKVDNGKILDKLN